MWLSIDDHFDREKDFCLIHYQTVNNPLSSPLYSSVTNLALGGAGESDLHIPAELPLSFCGVVHLILRLDPGKDLTEVQESNNEAVGNIIIQCTGGKLYDAAN